jgi:hypothetical protein
MLESLETAERPREAAAALIGEAETYLAFWAEAGPGRIPFSDEDRREAELAELIAQLNEAAELEAECSHGQ